MRDNGAVEVHVAATHGVFAGKAIERLKTDAINSVVVTDSIPLDKDNYLPKIKQLSVAPLLGEAIRRIHHHQSISEIFAEVKEKQVTV